MPYRRLLLRTMAGGTALAAGLAARARADPPHGTLDSAVRESLPGKQPPIKRSYRPRSYRPPNHESPMDAYSEVITANDRLFVRWHLSNVPRADAPAWRLAVGGDRVESGFECGT